MMSWGPLWRSGAPGQRNMVYPLRLIDSCMSDIEIPGDDVAGLSLATWCTSQRKSPKRLILRLSNVEKKKFLEEVFARSRSATWCTRSTGPASGPGVYLDRTSSSRSSIGTTMSGVKN
ncbi:hypothetical protein TKK_0000192 [Trichogramma kaykai]